MFAGEACLAKHLNVSPKFTPQVTKKKNLLERKKKLQISYKSLKKAETVQWRSFSCMCEITYTLTLWSSKMFVFSRPLILSTEKRIRIAGLRVEGSPTRKKNNEANKHSSLKK